MFASPASWTCRDQPGISVATSNFVLRSEQSDCVRLVNVEVSWPWLKLSEQSMRWIMHPACHKRPSAAISKPDLNVHTQLSPAMIHRLASTHSSSSTVRSTWTQFYDTLTGDEYRSETNTDVRQVKQKPKTWNTRGLFFTGCLHLGYDYWCLQPKKRPCAGLKLHLQLRSSQMLSCQRLQSLQDLRQ